MLRLAGKRSLLKHVAAELERVQGSCGKKTNHGEGNGSDFPQASPKAAMGDRGCSARNSSPVDHTASMARLAGRLCRDHAHSGGDGSCDGIYVPLSEVRCGSAWENGATYAGGEVASTAELSVLPRAASVDVRQLR